MSGILAIAHRGARTHGSENTLASFVAAIGHGADGIELDVHLTSDGKLVVLHDPTIDRTTNGSGEVCQISSDDLRHFSIDGKYPIPTLVEVLDALGPQCLINIELKTIDCALPTIALLSDYIESRKYDPMRFIVSSFDWTALQLIREKDPRIPVGVLTATDIDLAIAFARFIKAETIHPYYHLLSHEKVEMIHSYGMRVFVWTVNEPEDIENITAFKPDGIISDYPERI
jgi:glycerophosphoryl diester phosphodiesterase